MTITKPTTLRQKTVLAARRLLKGAGVFEPPVDVGALAHLQGVLEIRTEPVDIDAELVPVDDGFIIRVNESVPSAARRRFSIAHEIAHTFFLPHSPGSRNGPISLNSPTESLEHRLEERLCDLAAAEMLMPEAMFRERACKEPPSIGLIQRLANAFDVSLEAAALRYADAFPTAAQITCWIRRRDLLEQKWDRGTRIVPAEPFPLARPDSFSPIQKSLAKAYIASHPVTAHQLEPAIYPPQRIWIQAQGFRQRSDRYVLSLMQSAFSGDSAG